MNDIQRIVIIGNAAGGKTRLAKKLATNYNLPVTHVDSVQYDSLLNIRPLNETRQTLKEATEKSHWILDGFGPLDQLEKHFQLADRILFIDLPLWNHYYWFLKRQITNIWSPRPELPPGSNELNLSHTIKVIKTIWKVHYQMRPELIRILSRPELKPKVAWITQRHQLKIFILN